MRHVAGIYGGARINAGPPAQAVTAGYTHPMMMEDFDSASAVSSATDNAIASFYTNNMFYTTPVTSGSGYTIANSVLTLLQDKSGYGLALSSTAQSTTPALSTPSNRLSNTGHGICFQYGYFEARIKFNPNGFPGGTLGSGGIWFPAWWSTSWEGAQATAKFPYIEIDFMEAFPQAGNGGNVAVGSTIHQWTSSSNNFSNDQNGTNTIPAGEVSTPDSLPVGLDLTNWNIYGCLWTPTTIKWYYNNYLMVTVPTTTTTNVSLQPADTASTKTYTSANTDHVWLCLGTSTGWPMLVDYVHVWQ